ncbi:phosphate ABC transporter substrate-binding protein [Pseudoduganella namucuonensis]|uniref:Phosphate ABC transporter substrate-binding protein n=1 Tax=Pseudoduganella namucuonensis TaxID=1035707 RepID=A0A1I7M685_9BURK|nr:phosphate ABC transporter substrate-binding protein [Pseudoduganella namucuonensis]SFV17471.1 hypothetical protein SAMN05216552_10654 [Pseudoduganella namucuonensis]
MLSKKKTQAAMLALAIGLAAGGAAADVVVIVSSKNATKAITAEQASDIFLGRMSSFPGGGAVVPLDQSEGTAAREEFYAKRAGKSAAQLKAYWAKQIFTGKGQPPADMGGNHEVRKAVASDPNAIGYIDKSAVDSSVRVVLSQ